jgi:hypothetical protein
MHGAALLTPRPLSFALDLMAGFSVFFSDAQRCIILPVWVMDPDHDIALVRSKSRGLRVPAS